jgi:hypothetical protein
VTDPVVDPPAQPRRPASAWMLAGGLLVATLAVLGAATLGWVGVVVIVIVLAGMCGLVVRWSRWPRPVRDQS